MFFVIFIFHFYFLGISIDGRPAYMVLSFNGHSLK